jgi:hypothetical protein
MDFWAIVIMHNGIVNQFWAVVIIPNGIVNGFLGHCDNT